MNAIKTNPYRTLGLFGNSSEKELQKQIATIKRFAEVGKTKTFDYDFPFLGEILRNSEKVQEAASKIEQAKNKVHYALFWFLNNGYIDEAALNNLKEEHIDKAAEIWEKTLKDTIVTSKNFSAISNLSTLQLGIATNNGSFDPVKFSASIDLKAKLLLSEGLNNFVTTVVGEGISINREIILKEFADEILQIVKPYLNKTNGLTISQLINAFNSFPNEIKQYVSGKFTDRPLNNIENQIEIAKQKRNENPESAEEYGEELYKNTKEDLIFLKNVWGSNKVQFQILTDKIANEILQCSVVFFNKKQEIDSDSNFESNLNATIRLVILADYIAISKQVKERAKENLSTLLEMKDREINQAITLLQSVKEAYETNEANIMRQVIIQEASLGYGQSINWTKVNELIRNSLDWDKVIELIHEVIPSRNIEKIKNTQNNSKLEQFKDLVDFILDKMSYSNKNRIKYLCYWKTIQPSTSSRTTTSTSSGSYSGKKSSYSSSKKDLSYLPWVIGIGAGILGAIIGRVGGFVVGAIIGAIIGNVIKNNK